LTTLNKFLQRHLANCKSLFQSISFILCINASSTIKTTSLILFDDHTTERDYPNHGIINKELSNSLSSSFTLCIQPLWKGTDVFNQTEQRGMLRSSWLLNMKRPVILEQQRKKTSIT